MNSWPRWTWFAVAGGALLVLLIALGRKSRPLGLRGERIVVDIDKLAPAITDSTRVVLDAHRLTFHTADGQISDERRERVLREIGRNSAGVIALESDE